MVNLNKAWAGFPLVAPAGWAWTTVRPLKPVVSVGEAAVREPRRVKMKEGAKTWGAEKMYSDNRSGVRAI